MVYFEHYKVGDITRFGHYEVDRDEVIDFARKYDPQPAHLSDEGAAGTVFGTLAASGWHSCAMLMAMNVAQMQRDSQSFLEDNGEDAAQAARDKGAIGIGADELRWLKPVHPGDVLYCVSEVIATQPHERRLDKGYVRIRHDMFNQNDVRVLTYVLTGLFQKQPA